MATKKPPVRKFTPPAPAEAAGGAEEPRVLHVNGKPVPEEFSHLIAYSMTDEGQAEARLRDEATGNVPSGARVTGDAWDKGLDRRANAEPWDSFDPLNDAVKSVQEPGFSYRALSLRVCDKRGLRGWEPVLDKDNRQVKVGSLFLSRMPVELKEKRNAHYREIGEEALRTAEEQYAVDQEKLVRDANVRGLAPLRVGEHVRDREDPDLAASIGVHSQRGALGAER